MDRIRLPDLPAEAQAALVSMTPGDLRLLACEVRGSQLDDATRVYPSDAEGAARGARLAMLRPAALEVEDPLDAFEVIFRTMRLAIYHGSSDGLDKADCLDLWRISDLAEDLLRDHGAALREAKDRLRAFTHPTANK